MAIGIVGLKWWGPGPDDFSRASVRDVRALTIGNVAGPIQRRLLKHQAGSDFVVATRLAGRLRGITGSVVLAPHRVSPAVLQRLAEKGPVVAWLGDDPVGLRSPRVEWGCYSSVFAADGRWVAGATPLPWPHLVPEDLQIKPTNSGDGPFVIVGTAYPERVAAVRALMGGSREVLAVGTGWPLDIASSEPMARLQTLAFLRRRRATVINLPHAQMTNTYNPFFFDLAAAGIPQIVVGPPVPGFDDLEIAARAPYIAAIREVEVTARRTAQLQSVVLANHSFDSRLDVMF